MISVCIVFGSIHFVWIELLSYLKSVRYIINTGLYPHLLSLYGEVSSLRSCMALYLHEFVCFAVVIKKSTCSQEKCDYIEILMLSY